MKKVFMLAAVLLSLLLLFAGCSEDDKMPSKVKLALVEGGAPKYVLVRGDISDKVETDAAVKLRKALVEAYGVEFKLTTDWVKPGVQEETRFGTNGRSRTRGKQKRLIPRPGRFVIKTDGTKCHTQHAGAFLPCSFKHYISRPRADPGRKSLYNGVSRTGHNIYHGKGMNKLSGLETDDFIPFRGCSTGAMRRASRIYSSIRISTNPTSFGCPI